MTGGSGGMKSTQFKHRYRNQQLRIRAVIANELTPLQREAIVAVYFRGETLSQVADRRGVSRSTVCRTLQRAEEKLKRFLQY